MRTENENLSPDGVEAVTSPLPVTGSAISPSASTAAETVPVTASIEITPTSGVTASSADSVGAPVDPNAKWVAAAPSAPGSGPATTGAGPVPTAGTASGAPATGGVWTAQLPAQPEISTKRRNGTLIWGLILVLLGGMLIVSGFGIDLDPVNSLIILLGVAGLGMLVTAFLPNRRSS